MTNRMSDFARDGENANAALLVTLTPEDFPERMSSAGCAGSVKLSGRRSARAANYRGSGAAGGRFSGAPGQYDAGQCPADIPARRNALRSARCSAGADHIRARTGHPALDRKLRGFANPDAVLTAPETRSSSPVRILRGETKQSVGLRGLYPCGEGRGLCQGHHVRGGRRTALRGGAARRDRNRINKTASMTVGCGFFRI